MEKEKNNRKKIITGIIIAVCILLVVYLGMSFYFTNHFYFGSEINGISVSGETVEEANEKISSQIGAYKLELQGRDNLDAEITASDIGLQYNSTDKIQELKDSQNPFAWIIHIFKAKNSEVTEMASYDKQKLNKYINELPYFKKKNIVEPKNVSFKYEDGQYKVVDEVYGTKVNKETLYNEIVKAIANGKHTLNLEEANCYENPKYTTKSPEVAQTKDKLDKYVKTNVTYTIGYNKVNLDGSTINKWLEVNSDLNAIINETKVRNYVTNLAKTYNTYGKTRDFKTTLGTVVKVPGGDYGWAISIPNETQALMEDIRNGETVKRDPKYSQTAAAYGTDDIGNTYVELDMTKQHLWYYKDGVLVAEGDVVTGNESKKWGTPVGTYRLKYKEKNATLKGDNYSSKVDYWMPFNGGIGLHDASWRNKFGGEIYKNSGSHGCVNAPHALAEKVFNNIEPNTPVVCYFE